MATYTNPISFEKYKEDYPEATEKGYQIYLKKIDEQNDTNETQSPTGIISYKDFAKSFLGKPNSPSQGEIREAYKNMREGLQATASDAPAATAPAAAAPAAAAPTVDAPAAKYDAPKSNLLQMGPDYENSIKQSDQEKANQMTDDLKAFNNEFRPQPTSAASATSAAPIDPKAISEQEAARRAREQVDGQAALEQEADRRARGKAGGQAIPTPARPTPARPTPAKPTQAIPTQAAQAQSDQFKRYHGTAFDPNSRLDRQKMQAMQNAGVQMDKSGMGLQAPANRKTLTAANMYDKPNPNRKFSGGK